MNKRSRLRLRTTTADRLLDVLRQHDVRVTQHVREVTIDLDMTTLGVDQWVNDLVTARTNYLGSYVDLPSLVAQVLGAHGPAAVEAIARLSGPSGLATICMQALRVLRAPEELNR